MMSFLLRSSIVAIVYKVTLIQYYVSFLWFNSICGNKSIERFKMHKNIGFSICLFLRKKFVQVKKQFNFFTNK